MIPAQHHAVDNELSAYLSVSTFLTELERSLLCTHCHTFNIMYALVTLRQRMRV